MNPGKYHDDDIIIIVVHIEPICIGESHLKFVASDQILTSSHLRANSQALSAFDEAFSPQEAMSILETSHQDLIQLLQRGRIHHVLQTNRIGESHIRPLVTEMKLQDKRKDQDHFYYLTSMNIFQLVLTLCTG